MNKNKLFEGLIKPLDEEQVVRVIQELEDSDKIEGIEKLDSQKTVLEYMADFFPNIILRCKINDKFEIEYISDGIIKLTGYSPEEIKGFCGNSFFKLIYEEDRKAFQKAVKKFSINGTFNLEFRILRKSEEPLWIMSSIKILESSGEYYFNAFLLDISERKKIETELKVSQEQFRSAIECDDNIIFEYDIQNGYVNFSQNSALERMMQMPLSNKFEDFLESGFVIESSKKVLKDIVEKIKSGQNIAKCEILCSEGENAPLVWYEISVSTIYEKEVAIKGIGFARNITNIKKEAMRFKELAELDSLTGIANKATIQNRIKKELKNCKNCALVMIDVDNFKDINDFFGHSVGDEVIKSIASKLKDIEDDNTIVGRMGGDEFIVFCKNISEEKLLTKVNGLKNNLATVETSKNKDIAIKISIGIATSPKNGDSFEVLYRNADMALYYTKRIGGNNFCFYNASIGRNYKTFVRRIEDTKLGNIATDANVGRSRVKSCNSIIFLIIIVAMIIATTLFSSLGYYKTSLQKEVKQSLLEMSSQISDKVQSNFNNNLNLMGNIAHFIDDIEISSEEELVMILERRASENKFTHMSIVTDNYISQNEDDAALNGKCVMINLQHTKKEYDEEKVDDILAIIAADKPHISITSYNIDSEEFLAYSVPINKTAIAQNFKLIIGYIKTSELGVLLNTGAYDGSGFSHILDKNGDSVILSNNVNAIDHSFNLITDMKTGIKKLDKKDSVNKITEDFRNKRSGYFSFSDEYITKIGAYTPLASNDWILFTVVAEDKIFYGSKNLYSVMVVVIIGVFVLCIAVFILYFIFDNANKKTLKKLAYFDVLTDCPKLNLFAKRIEELGDRERANYAIIYTNIVNFKIINDRYGANVGDMVLVAISDALRKHISADEAYGRLNADHFGILMQVTNCKKLEERLEEICAEIHKKHFDNNQINIKIMFGVYSLSADNKNALGAIDNAIIALKLSNKTNIVNYYSKEIKDKMINDKRIEDRMYDALKNGEFETYFQPKMNIKTQKYVGAEALVRWNDKERGLVLPNSFIPLFEKNGFIIEIDLFVFERVCQILDRWSKEGKELIPLSFNFSRAHLARSNFIEPFMEIVERYGVSPRYLQFEFTETMAHENIEDMAKMIEMLHEKGFSCALDDFGSGSSSLSVLKDIHVDLIKIDKGFFLSNLVNEKRYEKIVKGVVTLARELEIETVAEGIEDLRQVAFLKSIGCNIVQGYYYSKVLKESVFEKLLFGDAEKQGGNI